MRYTWFFIIFFIKLKVWQCFRNCFYVELAHFYCWSFKNKTLAYCDASITKIRLVKSTNDCQDHLYLSPYSTLRAHNFRSREKSDYLILKKGNVETFLGRAKIAGPALSPQSFFHVCSMLQMENFIKWRAKGEHTKGYKHLRFSMTSPFDFFRLKTLKIQEKQEKAH